MIECFMENFGVISLAVIPVRSDPSERAEMVTQLLFGDLVEITERSGEWVLLRSLYDDYSGWVSAGQVHRLTKMEFDEMKEIPFRVNRRNFGDFVMRSRDKTWLPAGCSLYLRNGVRVCGLGEGYLFQGEAHPFAFTSTEALLHTAREYMGSPYLWGGKTYLGLDCSGLTQVVYKQHGIKLMRDAAQQAMQGEQVSFISESEAGDLAFFDHDDGKISHVGILINPHRILHCSGLVRIDPVDHQGIFNPETRQYTHSLRLIKRVVP